MFMSQFQTLKQFNTSTGHKDAQTSRELKVNINHHFKNNQQHD